MSESGVLSKRFVEILANMARFRNRLIHIYWEVDDGIIYKILQDNIQDVKEYLDTFMKFLSININNSYW